MAQRKYVGNAPVVAQTNRVMIRKGLYLERHIAEGSVLQATIGEKTLTARVPVLEADITAPVGPWLATDDSKAAQALLQDMYVQWSATKIPEFREIKCSPATQDPYGNWYIELVAGTPGVPFTVEFHAPYPVVDVDTIRNGGPGVDAIYSFWIDPASTGGTFRVQWDFGSGTETSSPIAYPPTAELIRLGMVSGMASVDDTNLAVTGSGTEADPWVLTLLGSLGSTETGIPYIATGSLTGGGVVSTAVVTVGSGSSGESVDDTFTGAGTAAIAITSHVGDTGHEWSLGDVNPSGTATDQADTSATVIGTKLYVLSQSGGNHGVNQWYVCNAVNNPALTSSNWVLFGSVLMDFATAGSPVMPSGNPTYLYSYIAFTDHNNKVYVEAKLDPTAGATVSTVASASGYTGRVTLSLVRVTAGVPTVLYTTTQNRNLVRWVRAASGGGLTLTAGTDLTGIVLSAGHSPTGSGGSPGVYATYFGSSGSAGSVSIPMTACGALGVGAVWGFGVRADDPTASGWTRTVSTTVSGHALTGVVAIVDRYNQSSSGTTNSVHAVWTNATTGTFTLTKPGGATTAAIDMSTGLSDVLAKLLTVYGSGNISIGSGAGSSADPWLVEHIGTNAGTDMPLITGNGAGLTGAGSATVTEVVEGTPPLPEQWSVTIVGASGGTYSPQYQGVVAATPVAYNGNAAALVASLATIDVEQEDGTLVALAATVTGVGSIADPFIITIDTVYEGDDVRQLVVLPDSLTGSDYPVFEHEVTQASHGPWHWNEPLNWINADTGAYGIPVDHDSIHCDWGDMMHCLKYDLDQSGLIVAGIYVDASFTEEASIGLPSWNPKGYYEYRETELRIDLESPFVVLVGAKSGTGSPLIRINTGTTKTLLTVYRTASPLKGEKAAVQFRGTHVDNEVMVLGGHVGVAWTVGQTAVVKRLEQHGGIVRVGHGTTLTDVMSTAGEIEMDRVTVLGVQEIR